MSAGGAVLDLRSRTRRSRPLFDASRLSDEERARAVASWRDRMVSEYVSARVFAALVPQAMTAGIDHEHVSRLSGMVADEIAHAELCGRVVRTLAEDPVAELPGDLPAVPLHEDAGPLEALVRNVISVSCCSETVAVALVGAERELALTPELTKLLSQILGDEVGHARFGWRLLSEIAPRWDQGMRARLSAYLVTAFRHQLAFHAPFLAMPQATDLALRVGAPDGPTSFRLVVETIENVTVPGLDRLGLDARRAWEIALTA